MQKVASRKGFTIAELLIVIVIIGILVTISALGYANATKTARSSQAKSNAYAVEKVAEAFYADKNRVPGSVSDFSSNKLAPLPQGVSVLSGSATLTSENGQASIEYSYLGDAGAATGGRTRYWDYETDAISTDVLYVGVADDSSTGWKKL